MRSIWRAAVICLIAWTLLVLATNSVMVKSQPETVQQRFNKSLVLIHEAEAQGATPAEVSELSSLLNRALELDEAIGKLRPGDSQRRAELQAQLNDIFDNLELKASQLGTLASERSLMNRAVAYGSAGVAAVVVTLCYAYGTILWQRYRVRRTFGMRIRPK